jgi:hypothetical protein
MVEYTLRGAIDLLEELKEQLDDLMIDAANLHLDLDHQPGVEKDFEFKTVLHMIKRARRLTGQTWAVCKVLEDSEVASLQKAAGRVENTLRLHKDQKSDG